MHSDRCRMKAVCAFSAVRAVSGAISSRPRAPPASTLHATTRARGFNHMHLACKYRPVGLLSL